MRVHGLFRRSLEVGMLLLILINLIGLLHDSRASALEIRSISAPELMAWMGEIYPPLLLDIRGSDQYLKGTIPGALNVGKDPEGFLPDGKGGPVVLFAPASPDPGNLARWIRRLESARHEVYLLQDGLEGWTRAGGELIKPEQVYVKPGTVPFVIPRGLCEGEEPAQEYE